MDELVNCANYLLDPKFVQTDNMELICPALQPMRMTVNINKLDDKEINNNNLNDDNVIHYTCCKCRENFESKDIFAYQEDVYVSSVNPICMICAKEVEDIKRLKDWADIDIDGITKVCARCKNNKPLSRYAENRKYCKLCLMKKKWSRYQNKIEKNYEVKVKYDCSDGVQCCKCFNLCKKFQSFVYVEGKDSTDKKFICLKCSLDVSDWYRLKDWEDDNNIEFKTKLCKRCKKYKSIDRFGDGKSGCEYCALKRKRVYLISKREKEEEKERAKVKIA